MAEILKVLDMLELANIIVRQVEHLQYRDFCDLLKGLKWHDPIVTQVKRFQRLCHLSQTENLRNFIAWQVKCLKVLKIIEPAHRHNAVRRSIKLL